MKFSKLFLGNRYVELYFDSPRPPYPSNTRRSKSKSNDSPHRSPSKPTNDDDDDDDDHNNNKSRSRSMLFFRIKSIENILNILGESEN